VCAFVYVYSAVCMALGKMTSLILPYANTEMMSLFLAQVAEDFKDYSHSLKFCRNGASFCVFILPVDEPS